MSPKITADDKNHTSVLCFESHEVPPLKKLMPAAKEPINFEGGKDMLQMESESIK
jgi:hypothetical protein